MSANVTELMLLVFKDEQSASEALKQLKQAQKEELIQIINAAELKKDEKGKVHYKEIADLQLRKKGRLIGAGTGAVLALLGGPAGLLVSAAVGAGIGGLTTRLKDKGVPNETLKEWANELDKGTSALVALVEHVWVDKVIDEVANYTASVVKQQLEEEASATILTVGSE
jgi:uncharacterized membrane protein